MSKAPNVLLYDIAWRSKTIESKDRYVKAYRKFKETGKPEYIGEAVKIYASPQWKLYLECMLLADCSNEECLEYFGCDEKVIEFYKKIFFDIDPVIDSPAKKYEIASQGRPVEVNFKMTSVKFGKSFIRWYLHLDDQVDEEDLEKFKTRLDNGVVMKALGHELIGSAEQDNNMYMKMIAMVKAHDKKNKISGNLNEIVEHFKGFFE